MKVLITGVAGLLGSRLADWIIENKPEVEVIGVDDLSGGYEENINPKVKFWQMDLVNHPIENIFEAHDIDYVFHFAEPMLLLKDFLLLLEDITMIIT